MQSETVWDFCEQGGGQPCVLGFPEQKGPSSAVGGMQVLLGIAEKEMDRKPGNDNLEWIDTWG